MFYKKKTFPEEGDIVLCTVKKILPHAVFVDLDEHENLEGMVHISEISPGRIRNLRDYVVEGKKLVCKVLRSDKDKKQLDLSYRRVPHSLQSKKNTEYKQEQRAERILEIVATQVKVDLKKIYDDFGYKMVEEYGTIHEFLVSILSEEIDLNLIPEKYRDTLVKTVKENIKLPTVKIEGVLKIESLEGDGIEIIKETLHKIDELAKKEKYELELVYLSAPNYRMTLTASDYKDAEKMIKNIVDMATKFVVSKKSKIEFVR